MLQISTSQDLIYFLSLRLSLRLSANKVVITIMASTSDPLLPVRCQNNHATREAQEAVNRSRREPFIKTRLHLLGRTDQSDQTDQPTQINVGNSNKRCIPV